MEYSKSVYAHKPIFFAISLLFQISFLALSSRFPARLLSLLSASHILSGCAKILVLITGKAWKWDLAIDPFGAKINKQLSPFGAKICSDICPPTLSVPRSYQFSESELEENCELRGTGNAQGQISEHVFAPNGGYCIYFPSNLFRNGRSFENWRIYKQ